MATLLAAGWSAGAAQAASGRKASTPSLLPATTGKTAQTGMASWHEVTGAQAGGRTAGVHRWHNSELVAAHRTLPLGSKVRVVDLENEKSVVVEIVDRGPYMQSRIIDLSVAAAIQLGMISAGVARVRLEPVVEKPAAAASTRSLSIGMLVGVVLSPWRGWGPVPAKA